jgi:hypothetical protein
VNASKFATISSVIRVAGSEVKSKAARKEAEVGVLVESGSSLGRLGSEPVSFDSEDDRFRLSVDAAAIAVILRCFSSTTALSMRMFCCVRASLIIEVY